MDITVRDTSRNKIGLIDIFESIIWIDKFHEGGTFELITPITPTMLFLLQKNYYLSIPYSEKTMIIDTLSIKTDVEKGDRFVISGRSLETILDRRIILSQMLINGASLQSTLLTILIDNVSASSQPVRNIPGFITETSSDPIITSLTLKAQYDGNNIYEVIVDLAKRSDFGFKVILNDSNQFVFSLYAGTNRSYDQSTNPYVVFSPNFDNLISSDYLESNRYLKTYTLIYGDPTSGPAHRVEVISVSPGPSGLDRRETTTDASDLSKFYEGTTTELPVPEYLDQLRQRGGIDLRKQKEEQFFEGLEDVTTNTFKYGIDFFLGDIVQKENQYGFQHKARVTEVIISENASGFNIYPTFTSL